MSKVTRIVSKIMVGQAASHFVFMYIWWASGTEFARCESMATVIGFAVVIGLFLGGIWATTTES